MANHQTAIDQTRSSLMLNANLPVGTAGAPGTQLTALNAGAMKLKLTSTASSGSASGTEISGTGYTAGGTAFSGTPTTSSGGADVLIPFTAISWTNGSGGPWSIVSLEIPDAAPIRVWYGNWNGQPVAVANGNTFQVAVGAIAAGGFLYFRFAIIGFFSYIDSMPRGAKRQITPAQDAEIACQYRAGRTTYEIADILGISAHPVADSLKRQGVPLRPGGRQPNWTGSPEQQAAIVAAYQSGESIRKIAARLHVRTAAVIETLDAAGIERWGAGSRRRFDDQAARQMADAYEAGTPITRIAEQHGTNATTIANYLKRQGVELRDNMLPHFWTADRVAEAAFRYEDGESQQQIAGAMGCSQAGVSYALTRAGVQIRSEGRPRGENHGSWKGGRRVNDHGYVEVKLPPGDPMISMLNSNGYVPEHRLVMARKLGRPLLPGERPHHKNTIRTNNLPGNLELWLTSQPSGGRVADLLTHALHLLETYMPEALVPGFRELPIPAAVR